MTLTGVVLMCFGLFFSGYIVGGAIQKKRTKSIQEHLDKLRWFIANRSH